MQNTKKYSLTRSVLLKISYLAYNNIRVEKLCNQIHHRCIRPSLFFTVMNQPEVMKNANSYLHNHPLSGLYNFYMPLICNGIENRI